MPFLGILKYDVTTYNYLFDGEAMTRPEKAQMVNELKAQIPKDDADLSHKPVIDFMSYIRSMTIN